MSEVYANGMEISAKKDDNKSICAMPDVCLSPPSPPAGPVPIPYPNTAAASDTSEGSKTVKIGGQEAGLKNKSTYKKSNGDEAATKSLGMGVVSHNIQGPMKHTAWSMDVKIEGENAIRHMDLTIHNHSNPPQPALVLNQAKQKLPTAESEDCKKLDSSNQDARTNDKDPAVTDGFTLTTASFTPPDGGASKLMKAATPQDIIRSGKTSGYAPPNKKKNMGCKQEEYGAQSPRQSAVENHKTRNHTEPKLMESIFQAAGNPTSAKPLGSMKMKIYHKDRGQPADSMPCDSCRQAICIAVDCGLQIKLCNKDNEEAAPPCEGGKPASKEKWVAIGLGA